MINALKTDMIQIGSKATGKEELLRQIASMATASIHLKDIPETEIFNALESREKLASTGLEQGIAIPHCAFPGLSGFTVGLVIIPKGINFDAIDGGKTHLVFFIIGPSEQRNKHINILSSISRLAKDKQVLKQLLNATSPESAYALLNTDIKPEGQDAGPVATLKSQVVIHVQQEDLFQDVLEILSSEVEGSVTVIDAERASSYLYRLPLFSTFWNDSDKSFSKIIFAVVEKRFLNDAIRRINMVRREDGGGILITATELLYADGSIDF